MRIEPTRSDPYSRNVIPAATAAAAPPLEPEGFQNPGFRLQNEFFPHESGF